MKVPHIAIPSYNLIESEGFYTKDLPGELLRKYSDRLTLNFFGIQLVIHLVDKSYKNIQKGPYPRHFGIVFSDRQEFDELYKVIKDNKLKLYKDLFEKHIGKDAEQLGVYLIDSSGNIIEFKWYRNADKVIG